MLQKALEITLKLLRFNATPGDMPFSRELSRFLIPLAIAVNFVQYSFSLPLAGALVQALLTVLVMIALTNLFLQAKQMNNRSQQTVNSLLATSSALTILLLPLLIWVKPYLPELATNPDLMQSPDTPKEPFFLIFILSIWSMAVTAYIYKNALEIRTPMALGLSILVVIGVYVIAGGAGLAVTQSTAPATGLGT